MAVQKSVAAHLKKSAAASRERVAPARVKQPSQQMKLPSSVVATKKNFSAKGEALLKGIEGLRLQPYDDQTGKAITSWVKGATIGYGFLIGSGDEWTTFKNGITATQAETLYVKKILPYITIVNKTLIVGVSQQQFDALVLLAYNIGETGFANSSVAKLINNPNAKTPYSSLERSWKAWNKSEGEINQGVINRRNSEWNIYLKSVYERW